MLAWATVGLLDGEVSDGDTEAFLRNYMVEFADFIGKVYTVLPRAA